MAIKLRVISDQYRALGEQRSRVFGVNGGTIGRAPDNDWVLPDPSRVVSGHHCEIEYRGGAYWLKDTSTNGVFVNDSEEPASAGGPRARSAQAVIAAAQSSLAIALRRRQSRRTPCARPMAPAFRRSATSPLVTPAQPLGPPGCRRPPCRRLPRRRRRPRAARPPDERYTLIWEEPDFDAVTRQSRVAHRVAVA